MFDNFLVKPGCHTGHAYSRTERMRKVTFLEVSDCIGPLDQPSAWGHRYCLCIVDSCSRWPTVYALKTLSAKAVCESLIDLFTHIGVDF